MAYQNAWPYRLIPEKRDDLHRALKRPVQKKPQRHPTPVVRNRRDIEQSGLVVTDPSQLGEL